MIYFVYICTVLFILPLWGWFGGGGSQFPNARKTRSRCVGLVFFFIFERSVAFLRETVAAYVVNTRYIVAQSHESRRKTKSLVATRLRWRKLIIRPFLTVGAQEWAKGHYWTKLYRNINSSCLAYPPACTCGAQGLRRRGSIRECLKLQHITITR